MTPDEIEADAAAKWTAFKAFFVAHKGAIAFVAGLVVGLVF